MLFAFLRCLFEKSEEHPRASLAERFRYTHSLPIRHGALDDVQLTGGQHVTAGLVKKYKRIPKRTLKAMLITDCKTPDTFEKSEEHPRASLAERFRYTHSLPIRHGALEVVQARQELYQFMLDSMEDNGRHRLPRRDTCAKQASLRPPSLGAMGRVVCVFGACLRKAKSIPERHSLSVSGTRTHAGLDGGQWTT
jgi:hypothetical protein